MISFREYLDAEEKKEDVTPIKAYLDRYDVYNRDVDKNKHMEKYLYFLRDVKGVSAAELQAFIDANY